MKNTEKNKSAFYKTSYTPTDKSACKPVLCGSEKGIVSFAVSLFASACADDILVVRARSYAKRMQAESTRAHTDF